MQTRDELCKQHGITSPARHITDEKTRRQLQLIRKDKSSADGNKEAAGRPNVVESIQRIHQAPGVNIVECVCPGGYKVKVGSFVKVNVNRSSDGGEADQLPLIMSVQRLWVDATDVNRQLIGGIWYFRPSQIKLSPHRKCMDQVRHNRIFRFYHCCLIILHYI